MRVERGPVSATYRAKHVDDKLTIYLADLLPVTIEADAGAVQPPKELTRSPGWKLFKADPVEIDDTKRWRRTYWLEPLAPGALPLKLEPWKIKDAMSEWREIVWPETVVQVKTVIEEVDPKSARTITSIEKLPKSSQGETPLWPWLALGGAGIAALGWAVQRRLRTPMPRVEITPRDWTLRQLARLENLRLPQKQATATYLKLLSLVLRGYLEKTCGIPARRWTTAELRAALASEEKISPEGAAEVLAILERADLLRFAGAETSTDECRELGEKAARFVTTFPEIIGIAPAGSLQRTSTSMIDNQRQ